MLNDLKYCAIFFSIAFGYSCNTMHNTETPSSICFDSGFRQSVQEATLEDVDAITRLHGKFVQLEGFFHYNFEDVALYPTKTSDLTKAIWVNVTAPGKRV